MSPDRQPAPAEKNPRANLLRLVLPIIIIIASAGIAAWMMQSGPKAKPRPKSRNAVLVDVRPIEFGAQPTTVSIMGTVRPKREVALKPQVSGEIIGISQHLIPGGHFTKNEELLAIDPSDYQLAAKQLASEMARAKADMQMELGRQRVAQKEYELLGEEVSAEEQALMLREPQRASSLAVLQGISAKLEQAQLDLQRTTVKAPFNAVVVSREVNLGTRVSPTTTLATLVGSDSYWIEAPIPASQLKWINTGRQDGVPGSPVRVYDAAAWGEDRFRTGHLIGMTAMVEENGRMARVLAEIPDPLALKAGSVGQQLLLLGSYVRVQIEGTTLPNAAAIGRDLVHDGNYLWIMDEQGQLDIRRVDIAFRSQKHVLVTNGVNAGERLVTSNLPSPVQGMSLRLKESETAPRTGAGDAKP